MRRLGPVLAVIFLFSLITAMVGNTEFDWLFTTSLSYSIVFAFLFFQSLTLIRLRNPFILKTNLFLFLLQLIILILFKLNRLELSEIYIWCLGILLLAIQTLLIDIQIRFSNKTILSKLIYIPVSITLLSFILATCSYSYLSIGFSAIVFSGILTLLAIFSYKEERTVGK